MTRRLTDVTEVTSANVDNDTVLVRSDSRGFVRRILLKHLFGGLPLLRGAGRALQKTGALVSRGDGNADLTVRIDGDDNGSGRGARLAVGGNRNEQSPAPGVWRLQDASGVWCSLYVDDNGVLRITRAAAVTALNPRPGRDVREIAGFELHDGVTTERTTIGDADRFFVSAEMESGAPHRYIEAEDIRSLYEMKSSYPSDEIRLDDGTNVVALRTVSQSITHDLGRVPAIILVYVSNAHSTAVGQDIPLPILLGPIGDYNLENVDNQSVPTKIQAQPTALSASAATIAVRHYQSLSTRMATFDGVTGNRILVSPRRLRFEFLG